MPLLAMSVSLCSVTSRFWTEHQTANLPVLLAARTAVLDRVRQIGGLFWSADFPWRVHLFLPRLLSKNEAEMCWPMRVVGGGVDDLHCLRPTAEEF